MTSCVKTGYGPGWQVLVELHRDRPRALRGAGTGPLGRAYPGPALRAQGQVGQQKPGQGHGSGASEALWGRLGAREVGLPVSWRQGEGVEKGQGLSSQVQYPPVGRDRKLKDSPTGVGADLQGPQKLVAALDACDVKKQVDGP